MPADIATDVSIPTVGMLDQSLNLLSPSWGGRNERETLRPSVDAKVRQAACRIRLDNEMRT